MSGFEDFSSYMSSKAAKLLRQQNVDNPQSLLFSGLRIYVNGRTETTLHDLKKLISENGGIFDHYFSSKTTHIIANQLPINKRTQSKVPMILEKWLLDCLSSNCLLDYSPYLTNPLTKASSSLNIDSYFENSRLHFISSLRDEIREQVAQHVSYLNDITWERVLHLDFDAFFASVSETMHPSAKGKPVVVCHGSGGTADVASCNYKSREFGIHNGMFLEMAKELCPDLVVLPYEFDAYRRTAYLFFEELQHLNLPVEVVSCDEAFVGMKDVPPDQFASMLKTIIHESCGITLSVGIGDNFLMAKMASKFAKPNGLFDLNCNNFDQVTEKLNVNKLPGVGRQREAILHGLGVQTFSDARNAASHQFEKHFGGTQGLKLYEAFHGKDAKTFEIDFNPSLVSVNVNWGIRLKDENGLKEFYNDVHSNAVKRLVSTGKHIEGCIIKIMMASTNATPRKYLGHGICDSYARTVNIRTADIASFRESMYTELLLLINLNGGIEKLRGCSLTFKLSSKNESVAPVVHIRNLETSRIASFACSDHLKDEDIHLWALLVYLDQGMNSEAVRYIDRIAIHDHRKSISLKTHLEKKLNRTLNSRIKLFR